MVDLLLNPPHGLDDQRMTNPASSVFALYLNLAKIIYKELRRERQNSPQLTGENWKHFA